MTNIAALPPHDKISLLDLLQVVADNLRLLVVGPLLVGLVALAIAFQLTPTFIATTKFVPPQQQQSAAVAMLQGLGALGSLAGAASGLKNPADQYVAFLKSRSLQDVLIERFKLMQRYDKKFREDTRLALSANTLVGTGKDGLITIDVGDTDPQFAAQLANAYVEELGLLLNRIALTEAQQRRVFFEKQLAATKDNLVKAEQALKTSGVNSSALKASPQAAVEGLAKLQAVVSAQEIKLASMRGYLAESSPAFKQAQIEMSAMRGQLARAEKETPAAAGDSSDYIAKFRDFKYHETLLDLFAKQYEMARVDESREGAIIQVVDLAQPPERKSKPKKAQIAMLATLVTALVLLLFVFVRQATRNARQNPALAGKMDKLGSALNHAIGKA